MSSGHLERLREALAPDPGEWRFTGCVYDTGMVGGSRCSCGQDIRYEFIITRSGDGAKLIIGSHCIETSVPYLIEAGAGALAGQLRDAYREHRRALDRERRDEKARRALVPARTDFHRLQRLLKTEQRRFGAAARALGREVILLPDDIRRLPHVMAEADLPVAGRTGRGSPSLPAWRAARARAGPPVGCSRAACSGRRWFRRRSSQASDLGSRCDGTAAVGKETG
jgi:hypothetical protein